MGIPLDVLESWSLRGKTQNSQNTYQAFRNIIFEKCNNNLDVFLQGSYHNSTHVKDNSDIDIVVVNQDIVVLNTYLGLNNVESLYDWKQQLFAKLNGAQNFYLFNENKTIKYEGNENYVPVDIVPCFYYKSYLGSSDTGIILYDINKRKFFVNYPKQHFDNGVKKSEITNGNYKKTVRMFKNARNKAYKLNKLRSEGVAPSYFLECLLYNVPNFCFNGNEQEVFYNVIKWLFANKDNLKNLKCQNGVQDLFEDNSNTFYNQQNQLNRYVTYKKWNTSDAKEYINSIVNLWDNWGK